MFGTDPGGRDGDHGTVFCTTLPAVMRLRLSSPSTRANRRRAAPPFGAGRLQTSEVRRTTSSISPSAYEPMCSTPRPRIAARRRDGRFRRAPAVPTSNHRTFPAAGNLQTKNPHGRPASRNKG